MVFVVLQTHNLLDALDLFVLHGLNMLGFAHIGKFSAQQEHAKVVSANDAKSRNSNSFSWASFRQDGSAVFSVFRAGIVDIR